MNKRSVPGGECAFLQVVGQVRRRSAAATLGSTAGCSKDVELGEVLDQGQDQGAGRRERVDVAAASFRARLADDPSAAEAATPTPRPTVPQGGCYGRMAGFAGPA